MEMNFLASKLKGKKRDYSFHPKVNELSLTNLLIFFKELSFLLEQSFSVAEASINLVSR